MNLLQLRSFGTALQSKNKPFAHQHPDLNFTWQDVFLSDRNSSGTLFDKK